MPTANDPTPSPGMEEHRLGKQKEYTGSAYIGVVGPEDENGVCRDSIQQLKLSRGDEGPYFHRATKGYEARQLHLNNWYNETRHPFLLLLDHDMKYQPDTLERLRSHKLPYVSGFYLRRSVDPVAPVWYRPFTGRWPMEPWIGPVERGRLHHIGASGWGCILLHREVVTAVRPLLKGEWEIIEDDMDIYPYNLGEILGALGGLRDLIASSPPKRVIMPALEKFTSVLEDEIKPLRVDREVVGSDIRFPFFALKAGYKLVGDPETRPAHNVNLPLHPDQYETFPIEHLEQAYKNTHERVLKDRRRLQEQRKAAMA